MADSKTDDIAIKVHHVSKTFKLPLEKNTSIKGAFVNFYKRNRSFKKQQVLKDVTFEIKQGEFFGIVGRNGSGKSTLLKLLAGIYSPDSGAISIEGKLTPFIELGVGFNPELTGRENVFLNGALLGFNRREMDALYDDIVSFAELEDFMDQKLKNYSSGMQVRLAFSIAIRAKSDVLLIDEVLAVGDAAFQTKCFDYFQGIKNKDITVIFVSHDRSSLERFCERGVLINEGEVITYGPIRTVLKDYSKIVMAELDNQVEVLEETTNEGPDLDNSYVKIVNTHTANSAGVSQKRFTFGEEVLLQYEAIIKKDIVNPILGVTVFQKNVDKAIYATNTLLDGAKNGTLKAGERVHYSVKFPSGLNDGEYYVEPAVANESASVFYDQIPQAASFFINGSDNPYSILSGTAKSDLKKSKA